MRLITQVTSLDTSSMLLKRFPWSGFFNFGNKSNSGGLSPPDWIGLAQDRWRALVSAVRNLRVPQNAGNLLTSWKPVSFSRRTLLHGVSKYNNMVAVKQFSFPVILMAVTSEQLELGV
jgi:hypothetical protein